MFHVCIERQDDSLQTSSEPLLLLSPENYAQAPIRKTNLVVLQVHISSEPTSCSTLGLLSPATTICTLP